MWKASNRYVRPSRAAYNTALNVISKSGIDKSASGAESLLQRMVDLFCSGEYRYGDMRLGVIYYIRVMNAWVG